MNKKDFDYFYKLERQREKLSNPHFLYKAETYITKGRNEEIIGVKCIDKIHVSIGSTGIKNINYTGYKLPKWKFTKDEGSKIKQNVYAIPKRKKLNAPTN